MGRTVVSTPGDVAVAPAAVPDQSEAVRILSTLGIRPRTVQRFPTGQMHYVYDVITEAEERLVLRLARADLGATFAGAAYWHHRLKPLAVPLPALLYVEPDAAMHRFPVMLMERLPGTDLEYAYPDLTAPEKERLAQAVVTIQAQVASLPHGPGFGYARSATDPLLKRRWIDVLNASVARSRRRILDAGVIDATLAGRVQATLNRWRSRLERVVPVCFLDDTTTKNVIVHAGRLSGIVDVDTVCFGDPLLTPALTRMALLSRGYETDYIEYWKAALKVTAEEEAKLDLYTAECCLGFLSEIGQRFNKDAAPAAEAMYIVRLTGILDALLARL